MRKCKCGKPSIVHLHRSTRTCVECWLKEQHVCAICGKKIMGRSVSVTDGTVSLSYHPQCYSK